MPGVLLDTIEVPTHAWVRASGSYSAPGPRTAIDGAKRGSLEHTGSNGKDRRELANRASTPPRVSQRETIEDRERRPMRSEPGGNLSA